MLEAFRLGGWGMYPTLFIGIVLVISAARYAVRAQRGSLPFVLGLAALTFMSGSLGFVTGVIKTTTCTDDPRLVIVGIGESLVNVGLALVLLMFAGIGVVLGLARRGQSGGVETVST